MMFFFFKSFFLDNSPRPVSPTFHFNKNMYGERILDQTTNEKREKERDRGSQVKFEDFACKVQNNIILKKNKDLAAPSKFRVQGHSRQNAER